MGVTVSKEEEHFRMMKQKSRIIDNQIKLDSKKDNDVIKLLLLGTAECGKSTVLKQMKILHGIGFSEKEIRNQKTTIFLNIISAMNDILTAMPRFSLSFDDSERETDASMMYEGRKFKPTDNDCFPISLRVAIKNLWYDIGIQKCYLKGSEYQLYDSAKYFFDNIDRIGEPNYVPNDQDILRSRVATTGITEIEFNMKNAIVRLHESIMLFKKIANSQFFVKSAMILFLNKTDIFSEKIDLVPITVAFPDYKGQQNVDDSANYIQTRFIKVVQREQKPYVHRTCATDTKAIEFVFESCFNIVVEANLKSCGV